MIGALVTPYVRSGFLPAAESGERKAVRQGRGPRRVILRIEVANKNKAFSGLSIA